MEICTIQLAQKPVKKKTNYFFRKKYSFPKNVHWLKYSFMLHECYGPGRGHKENGTSRLWYRYIFTRTKDGYKSIGWLASSHYHAGARLASGSRSTAYCCVFRYYGEWLSPLVGDSATTMNNLEYSPQSFQGKKSATADKNYGIRLLKRYSNWFVFLVNILYKCGRIFFILSFFVGYILFGLVRLRTIRLSARASAHIECSSRSCVEDVTITNFIQKKKTDRK